MTETWTLAVGCKGTHNKSYNFKRKERIMNKTLALYNALWVFSNLCKKWPEYISDITNYSVCINVSIIGMKTKEEAESIKKIIENDCLDGVEIKITNNRINGKWQLILEWRG